MTTHHSNRFTRRFAKLVLAVAFVAGSGVALHGPRVQPAEACGWFGPTYVELTTFDPDIAGNASGLYYNPDMHGFGGACEDCSRKALVAEWAAYLKEAVTAKDWEAILYDATPIELSQISAKLAGKAQTGPKKFESSSIWKGTAAAKDKLKSAVALVELARSLEPFASFESEDSSGNPRSATSPAHQLMVEAKNGFKGARDPFLTQRYGFQVLRGLFYSRDWAGAIAFFDKNQAALTAPSSELAGKAHYYLAGALSRNGQSARSNLELSRVFAGYPSLSAAAAEDFKPLADGEWKMTLALAKTPKEKTDLWGLVGLTKDGLAAATEIVKIDPKSNMIGLLLVRELAKAEFGQIGEWGPPDPKDVAAAKKTMAAIEQIAQKQIANPNADRPWLMRLIAAHVAAKRGDVPTVKAHIAAAVSARPGDLRVASQAKASLAVALALTWKPDANGLAAREEEIAKTMNDIDQKFGRYEAVSNEVREKLAKAYIAANRFVDAEFLHPGSITPDAKGKNRWLDAAFIKEMIARTQKSSTEFDKFVLKSSYTRETLERELALRYLLDGDFATASSFMATAKQKNELLHTDPFVIHIVDCHDCDHEKFANAKWTNASFVARLVELDKAAKGNGEPAAEAALAIGNAMYNITWYGNARIVTEDTHQVSSDGKPAERWYKKAFDLTKNRELKAKAAYLASKAELATMITAARDPNYPYTETSIPTPKTWFPVLKGFRDTKYYKEVLKECGNFSSWVATSH